MTKSVGNIAHRGVSINEHTKGRTHLEDYGFVSEDNNTTTDLSAGCIKCR